MRQLCQDIWKSIFIFFDFIRLIKKYLFIYLKSNKSNTIIQYLKNKN